MKSALMVFSIVTMLVSCGRPESSSLEGTANGAQTQGTEVVVLSHKVVGANGGINPSARASEVSVVVQAGSNACMASGSEFSLERVTKANVIHLIVKRTNANIKPVMCPMNYMPVYKTLSIVIRSTEGRVPAVAIDNYKSMNNTLRIKL